MESGVIGLAGGLGGLLLACLGLWLVRRQPADYAPLAHLDGAMLLMTFLLAVGSSLVRKRVVSGQSVSVRVDLGGRRIINNTTISATTVITTDTHTTRHLI